MIENSELLRSWMDALKLDHPLVIAGPCSAETEEQVITIAHLLKDLQVSVMRAGIWKPRTRPGKFEGVGAVGLPWLQKAREETGLRLIVEVANTDHVDSALEHDIDMLWIGARTTVSPFVVQELCEALKGVDKPVLVKNPVNPDLGLWIGAIERFYEAGVKNLGAVHRGFSTYDKINYRNNPEWQIPIELKNRLPQLPLLVDPSHIAGRRDKVFEVCQTALDLNYDGLMVETHHDPDNAWSDAQQQVDPVALKDILGRLTIRNKDSKEGRFVGELGNLRTQIDEIDNQIVELMGRRMRIANSIGSLKKENNVAILQVERWNQIMEKMIREGADKGLSEEFILKMYKAIHQESINHQEDVYKKK